MYLGKLIVNYISAYGIIKSFFSSILSNINRQLVISNILCFTMTETWDFYFSPPVFVHTGFFAINSLTIALVMALVLVFALVLQRKNEKTSKKLRLVCRSVSLILIIEFIGLCGKINIFGPISLLKQLCAPNVTDSAKISIILLLMAISIHMSVLIFDSPSFKTLVITGLVFVADLILFILIWSFGLIFVHIILQSAHLNINLVTLGLLLMPLKLLLAQSSLLILRRILRNVLKKKHARLPIDDYFNPIPKIQ